MRVWRRFMQKGGRVAHTALASRPRGSLAAVCGVALSLRAEHVEARADVADCARCAARRGSAHARGEKIGSKVKRSLYEPAPVSGAAS